MTVANRTGFEATPQNLWITKDPEAKLIYTLDWSEWLETGDTIVTAVQTVAARVNDPVPMTKVSDGIQSGTKTYIELAAGQAGKTYVVTVKITTANGLIDRRNFRVQVENRTA